MPRGRRRAPQTSAVPREELAKRASWWVVAVATLVIPLWFSGEGRDPFRTPKLLLFRAEGCLLFFLCVWRFLYGQRPQFPSLRHPHGFLPIAIFAWSCVVTLASTDRSVSAPSVVTVGAAVMLFYCAWEAGRTRDVTAAGWLMAAALVNSAIAILQVSDKWNMALVQMVWSDMPMEVMQRTSPIALLGHRDDLGVSLVPAALLAVAVAWRGGRRSRVAAAVATGLVAGLVASKTVTAIAAFVAALILFMLLRSWRIALIGAAVLALSFPLIFELYPDLNQRRQTIVTAFHEGNLDRLVVGRFGPALAAAAMTRDHPLTGVGPGLFGRHYLDYRNEIGERYRHLLTDDPVARDYFLQVHNDHLQIAAEAGLPAWVLMIAAMVSGAAVSFRRRQVDSEKRMIARSVALPLFVALFIVSVAQFPLQLGAGLQAWIFAGGIVLGWGAASD